MTTITETPTKKTQILDAAQNLMLEKGYEATAIDEICKTADVTKGSFFYYFSSKEDLGKELVVRFAGGACDILEQGACCGGDDPLDRIYGYIDMAIQMSKDPQMKGCLVGTFAQELCASHPEIRELCESAFQGTVAMFKKDLSAAKKAYAPKTSIDVDGLAECFLTMSQGAMLVSKATHDRDVMERTLKHYKQYLKTLFGR